MPEKRLISAAEAARRLGVDKSTTTRWIAAGKLPAFRTPGGHWRVRAVDVEALRSFSGHQVGSKSRLRLLPGGKPGGESPAK